MSMERELLYKFFEGTATATEQNTILEWVEADSANERELLSERRLYDALLLHAPDCKGVTATAKRPFARVLLRRVAALAAAACVGGALVASLDKPQEQMSATITVPAGQHIEAVLPDGTHVCLNACSELRYPSSFSGRNRCVQLRGEAFFDVAHDSRHPFVVETYACDVEVLGTKFDVEARAEADRFTTSLVEGCVRITDKSDAGNRVELQPGHRAMRSGARLVVEPIPEHEGFQWREGLIAFRDAPFGELLDRFEKYYGVRIEMRRTETPGVRFTGRIRISDGIDHALRVLQRSADFSYERNDAKGEIYIL